MRDRILQRAGQQIMRFGFRKFTIDSIASELGISKKTVYKFFSGKQEIISTVVDEYIKKEKASTLSVLENKSSWLDRLSAVISLFSEVKISLWLLVELQRFFPGEWAKVQELRKFKQERVHLLFAQGISTGDIHCDLHPDVITAVLDKALDNLLDQNFLKRQDMTANQLIDQVRHIFLYGILRRT